MEKQDVRVADSPRTPWRLEQVAPVQMLWMCVKVVPIGMIDTSRGIPHLGHLICKFRGAARENAELAPISSGTPQTSGN
jgi:hypothetical protein